jgi:hypothetical protein
MRIISDDLLDLVAGGRIRVNDETTVVTVTITGTPIDPGSGNPPYTGGGSNGGGTNNGPHHSTPAPAHMPANVNIDALRNTVLSVSQQLEAMTKNDGKEHGALIVRTANGDLRVGPISTGTEENNTATVDLAPGEEVVGWVHDHPTDGTVDDQREASVTDMNNLHSMEQSPNVDPNTLVYIADMKTGDTYEYQTNYNARTFTVGPDISKDMP